LYVTGFVYISDRGHIGTGIGFIFDYGFIGEFIDYGFTSGAALRLQSRG